jgi:hypothetical protein
MTGHPQKTLTEVQGILSSPLGSALKKAFSGNRSKFASFDGWTHAKHSRHPTACPCKKFPLSERDARCSCRTNHNYLHVSAPAVYQLGTSHEVIHSGVYAGASGRPGTRHDRAKPFQFTKIDGYVFWDQNVCIVSDAYSPISSTGIDKIKHLSITCLYIMFLIFTIHRANRPWLTVEVIHTTKQ